MGPVSIEDGQMYVIVSMKKLVRSDNRGIKEIEKY